MADISKIKTPNGVTYDLKDSTARSQINALPAPSNPNILINPDFRVNQRGVSGTISAESGESIVWKKCVDRWDIMEGSVTINADGTLTLNGMIGQVLENEVDPIDVVASSSAGTAVYGELENMFFIIGNGDVISWAKLEYGKATPFISPNITEEQIKCQRYFLGLNTYIRYPMTRLTSSTIDFIIPVNAGMRATPTIRGTPVVYNAANVSAQTGFSFSVVAVGINAIVIRATKSNHGLTSSYLDVSNGVSLDADI